MFSDRALTTIRKIENNLTGDPLICLSLVIYAATWGVLKKKNVLKSFTKLTRKRFCQSLHFNKDLDRSREALVKKRDSGTDVLLWILQSF